MRDQRSSVLFDELDDFPYDPSLRIPPLHDPTPTSASSRPPPLEPSTRSSPGMRNANATLKTRIKALAEAVPIGEPESDVLFNPKEKDVEQYNVEFGQEAPRKRQKLNDLGRVADYFKLPKPTAHARVEKPPPFQPISVLNELHEPPPSVALFPPITPNADLEQSILDRNYPITCGPSNRVPKRMNLRPRLKWTEEETRDLLRGVETFGMGKWKKILTHSGFGFAPERTAVDLKDRYRTCQANSLTLDRYSNWLSPLDHQAPKESDGSVTSNFTELSYILAGDGPIDNRSRSSISIPTPKYVNSGTTTVLPAITASGDLIQQDNPLPSLSQATSINSSHHTLIKSEKTNDLDHTLAIGVNVRHPTSRGDRIFRQPYPPADSAVERSRKRKPKNHWTEDEDNRMMEGYRRHGYQWTAITKDSDLALSHRTGPQVRDRFRLKCPDLYLTCEGQPKPREERKRGSSDASYDEVPQHRRSDSFAGAGGGDPSQLKLEDLASSRENDHEHDRNRDNDNYPPSSSSSDPDDDPNLRSRQSSIGAGAGGTAGVAGVEEDSKHLGILGLLNEDVGADESGLSGDGSKLPSFKYTYDDWEGDSLTLPPLLWEEMATRPMFELE
ncbi:MAG: hypothetical protein MMC33_006480 [Icmadophila ericetorum]|nr:hypothetical protein [Icmadophila ericetorum]